MYSQPSAPVSTQPAPHSAGFPSAVDLMQIGKREGVAVFDFAVIVELLVERLDVGVDRLPVGIQLLLAVPVPPDLGGMLVAHAVGDGINPSDRTGHVVERIEPELGWAVGGHPGLAFRQAVLGRVADDLHQVPLQVPDAVPLSKILSHH